MLDDYTLHKEDCLFVAHILRSYSDKCKSVATSFPHNTIKEISEELFKRAKRANNLSWDISKANYADLDYVIHERARAFVANILWVYSLMYYSNDRSLLFEAPECNALLENNASRAYALADRINPAIYVKTSSNDYTPQRKYSYVEE